jgi:murein DD-endopeptidase MepM/ murein hydrolase activator NlpD
MAGCCPPAPPSTAIGAAFAEANGPESDIRPGESVECYMARGGNTTGLQDDATENVLNKIENTAIPLTVTSSSVSVQVQFKLTSGSTRTASSWSIENLPDGLTLSSSGLLSGTFSSSGIFKINIIASDGTGVIDSRAFVLGAKPSSDDTKIQLISPLPGAIVNSKFGPRMHPIQKVMKPHTGIDMKYADRSVKNVRAAADGEVILAGGNTSTGYGIRIWIKHLNGSGIHLCTTTYNHLSQIYVSVGQKVMAGQKIGLEGSTGASTGNHLHFECRLPDGKFIDPLPLIRDSISVADKTLENGDADPSSINTHSSNASLTPAEVQARQQGCAPFGPSYPADPADTSDPVPTGLPNDPFELAWYFTMKHEVGPFWSSSSPSDSEVSAGLIDTAAQRKKVGYVNTVNYPGGETKFGVAQKPNPGLVVKTATYDAAKKVGYNSYWKSAPKSCINVPPYLAIMLFDMNYLHGGGNAKTIWNNSGISSVPLGASQGTQLAACEELYAARVAFIRRIPRPEFTVGWLKRAKDCLEYIKTLPAL